MYLDNFDKIIACSTADSSNAAIAIIRLSGFNDLAFLENTINVSIGSIEPRRVYYGSIFKDSLKLDDIILTYYKAPHSYNGENILELSVHGNLLNINRIIDLFVERFDFRRAYPGEFTYRALKNKKLNLSQVEGLDLLLNANSNYALEQGNSILSGELKDSYLKLYESFLNHKSSVELSIDFYDDLGEEQSFAQLNSSFKIFYDIVDSLFNRSQSNVTNILSPEICLIGKPNSGKSTLFNSLVKADRAIVSDQAGTTRDFIKENIYIKGNIFSLVDTAGVRESEDKIELIGIKKALSLFENSFFKILVVNPTNDFSFDMDLKEIDLIIITHLDQLSGPIGPSDLGPMGAKILSGSMGPQVYCVDANSLSPEDFSVIFDLIANKHLDSLRNKPITISRHRDVIKKIHSFTSDYSHLIDSESDISIISSELNIIGHCISELIGIIKPEDVLNNIFDNFCIGK